MNVTRDEVREYLLEVMQSMGDEWDQGGPLSESSKALGDLNWRSIEIVYIARAVQQQLVQARPDSGGRLSGLGLIDAGLGRKEDAIREGRQAVELTPIAKDSLEGPEVVTNLAAIYAWVGQRDLAIEQLEIAAKIPNGVHYGDLRLDPTWDPLRGDSRFEKIVNSLAPR